MDNILSNVALVSTLPPSLLKIRKGGKKGYRICLSWLIQAFFGLNNLIFPFFCDIL